MSYINDTLKENFLSISDDFPQFMASMDKNMLEKDILNDAEPAFQPFTCTYESRVDENYERMEEADKELVCDLYDSIQCNKIEARRALKQLQKLKKKYPDVSVIYNFIGVAYQTLGKKIKYNYAVKQTCKKFPNYLFGKISLAEDRLHEHRHEDIPEIFGHKLQLYLHYPDAGENPIFHGVEVEAFYTVIGCYYARNKQLARAIKCYCIVEDADHESRHLDALAKEIVIATTVSFFSSAVHQIEKDSDSQ